MTRTSYIFLGFVLVCIAFEVIGWPYHIRFMAHQLNYFVFSIMCFSLPIALWLVTKFGAKARIQFFCFMLSILVGLPAGFLGVLSTWEGIVGDEGGRDLTFEKIDEQKVVSVNYRLYVADYGTGNSPDLVLQKEIDLAFGIKLTSIIWKKDTEFEAVLSYQDDKIIISSRDEVFGVVPI